MVGHRPPTTSRAHSTSLPVQRGRLIGREREAAAVRHLLLREDVGLVTLTGPGGTGKSRLALQVAADCLDAFPDGACLVALAAVRDPELIVPTIAQALGVKEAGDQSLLTNLVTYLRDEQLLLLLDNFEQVLDAAPLVTGVLGACPGLTVLVTSRAALRLSGEHEFPVPPLALPDLRRAPDLEALSQCAAVALFVERARAVRPDFALTAANAGVVAEICVRLDGLSLALELAAARLKLLSPPALLARLSKRLQILTGGSRDLPARQQTLRATIAWSYDLLTAEEQSLFQQLAPLIGGFTLSAAEALGADVPAGGTGSAGSDAVAVNVLDALTSLVDKSLLQRAAGADDEPRFTMLETIREFALEPLEASGEADLLREHHARYVLAWAETVEPVLFGRESALWLSRLEEEHDNLRAALQWALTRGEEDLALRLAGALAWFWYDHGHLSEGRRWLGAAAARGESRALPRGGARLGHWNFPDQPRLGGAPRG